MIEGIFMGIVITISIPALAYSLHRSGIPDAMSWRRRKERLDHAQARRDALRMYDHLSPQDALTRAWRDAGRSREFHERGMAKVYMAMPLVARAIERIAKEQEEKNRE